MKRMKYIATLASVVGVMIATIASYGDSTVVTVHENPDTHLLTWTAESDGFSIELIQLLPDFVRAIYGNHNFPKNEIEDIAGYCVFGSIIKNTSDKTLKYNVADWRYITNKGEAMPIKTKSQWLEQWRNSGITFSWTLLPDAGTFHVGDWQQGFTTIKLPRNSEFDLVFKWQLEDAEHVGTIENLRCPPDSHGQ